MSAVLISTMIGITPSTKSISKGELVKLFLQHVLKSQGTKGKHSNMQ
jgi:hypothetical protein